MIEEKINPIELFRDKIDLSEEEFNKLLKENNIESYSYKDYKDLMINVKVDNELKVVFEKFASLIKDYKLVNSSMTTKEKEQTLKDNEDKVEFPLNEFVIENVSEAKYLEHIINQIKGALEIILQSQLNSVRNIQVKLANELLPKTLKEMQKKYLEIAVDKSRENNIDKKL